MAFVLDAEIPALLRKGPLEALGVQLVIFKDALSLLRHGVCVPLGVNAKGHHIVSVIEFGSGPNFAASFCEWSFLEKRPDLSDGGLHLPLVGSGLIRFVPPQDFSACMAVTLGNARGDGSSDPNKIITK